MLRYSRIYPNCIELLDDFTVRKTAKCSTLERLNFIQALTHRLMNEPDDRIVPVLGFQYLGSEGSYCHKYSYDMLRLAELPSTARQIIIEYPTVYYSMNRECAKLIELLDWVENTGIYDDLHIGNVMMDEDYNFRLIDLEGFTLWSDWGRELVRTTPVKLI
jgi:hypothetical protein